MSRNLLLTLGLTAALAAVCPEGAALAARKASTAQPAAASDSPPAADAPAAAYDFGGLLGLDQDHARARLGPPDLAQAQGAGAMWTFRQRNCALFVFFRADAGQPLKVSGAAAGQRRRGLQVPTLEACIAEALRDQAQAVSGRSRP